MVREGETTWLDSIWWLVNFAPLTMVNRNGLNVSFFLYLFLPEALSPSALATHCWTRCRFPGTKQSVSISPAWQCFCLAPALLLCLLAGTSTREWHSRAPICWESGGKPLCGPLHKQGAVPNVTSHHTRARRETRPSSGKGARVQKSSLLHLGIKWKALQVSSLPGMRQEPAGWRISWGRRRHIHKSSAYVIQSRAGAWLSHI